MNRTSLAMACIGLISCASSALATPRTFIIKDQNKDGARDTVVFTSDAPLELINGHTNKIEGSITIDDSTDLTKPVQANFDVDLASIDTGIPLRNEHMRDNFLQTKDYPKASFVLSKLINPPKKLETGKKLSLKAEGQLTIHGKSVKKTIPIDVTYFSRCPSTEHKVPGCDLLQIKANFPVAFKDHAIQRPEIVFQKLADTVIVTVSGTAYNQVSSGSSKAETKATEKTTKK